MKQVTVLHCREFMGLKGIENGLIRFNHVRVANKNAIGEVGRVDIRMDATTTKLWATEEFRKVLDLGIQLRGVAFPWFRTAHGEASALDRSAIEEMSSHSFSQHAALSSPHGGQAAAARSHDRHGCMARS